jgi:hypothetical protein
MVAGEVKRTGREAVYPANPNIRRSPIFPTRQSLNIVLILTKLNMLFKFRCYKEKEAGLFLLILIYIIVVVIVVF